MWMLLSKFKPTPVRRDRRASAGRGLREEAHAGPCLPAAGPGKPDPGSGLLAAGRAGNATGKTLAELYFSKEMHLKITFVYF